MCVNKDAHLRSIMQSWRETDEREKEREEEGGGGEGKGRREINIS